MDVQTLCLGVLTMGDASGYEIKKVLEGPFRHFYDASFGSIYPALNKLQAGGLVTCNYEPQDKRPDKKVYSLTVDGRLELLNELRQVPGEDRVRSDFLATMIFAELLPANYISRIVDARIDELRNCIEHLERVDGDATLSPGKRFVNGYGLAVYRAALAYMEDNRYLVESEALLAQVERDQRGEVAAASAEGDD
jgi:DNA-binding PadR family transcriptional regulator